MSKKISMQHIADRLGLSKYSVSQALSGKQGVSEETREKVIEAAKSLGYESNTFRKPRKRKSDKEPASRKGSFVLICIDPERRKNTTFWNRVETGVIDACNDNGWDHLIISNSVDEQEFEFPSYADRSSCIGTIVMGGAPNAYLLSIKKQGFPIILADHFAPSIGLDCIVNDNFDAAKALCQFILSPESRSIVFVGDDDYSVSFGERRWGCQVAVMEQNEKWDTAISFARWDIPFTGPWREALETEVKMLDGAALPDCFVCANDGIAIAVIGLLTKYGYSVPKQCKVAGFDDIESAAYSNPSLSTIDFGKEALGRRAVDALKRRVAQPDSPTEKIVLSYKVVVRQST